MKGKRIKSLNALRLAVDNRKSVEFGVGGNQTQVSPAAWIYMQSACRVHYLLKSGLYIYKPKAKKHRS